MNDVSERQKGLAAFLVAYRDREKPAASKVGKAAGAQDPSSGRPAQRFEEYRLRPYPGLRAFDLTDSDIFFGRQEHVDQLLRLLKDQQVIAVLGGSGSGKSSVVRAGVIPALTSSYKLEERLGRWYVAELKPGMRPVDEFCDALWKQICSPVLDRPNGGAALAAALGVGGELRARLARQAQTPQTDRQALREAFNDELRPDHRLSLDAGLWFACDVLDRLDRELNPALRSGEPSLMVVIDQFEELFGPEVNSEQRDDLLALLKSVFDGSKDGSSKGFYSVITMRSEQLHRCAEYPGLSEIINGSTYLIDLIDDTALRKAIISPARRVFDMWDIPRNNDNNAPFDPDFVTWLMDQSAKLRESLGHKPDQLPMIQHALRLIWNNAAERWDREPQKTILSFEDRPEWDEGTAASFLPGCLNFAVDQTYEEAKTAYAGPDDLQLRADADRRLRAFCIALADRDDRGNWTRRLVTQTELLEVLKDRPLRRGQNSALDFDPSRFQSAINVFVARGYFMLREHDDPARRAYEVCHEALIRHWDRYQQWLNETGNAAYAMVRAADNLVPQHATGVPERWPELEPYRPFRGLRLSWWLGKKERSAEGVISENERVMLTPIFGKNATFGKNWATEELIRFLRERARRRGENVQEDSTYEPAARRLLATMANAYRLAELGKATSGNARDAQRQTWKNWSYYVPRPDRRILALLMGILFLACGSLAVAGIYQAQRQIAEANVDMLEAQSLMKDERPRFAAQSAFDTIQSLKRIRSIKLPTEDKGLRNYRLTLFHVETAARKMFQEPQLIDNPRLLIGESERPRARCVALEPSVDMGRPDYKGRQSLLVETQGGYRGLGWVGDAKEGYRWAPVFEPRDRSRAEFERDATVFSGPIKNAPYLRSWAGQAIQCLSNDGSFVLTWENDQPPQVVALPWFPIETPSERRWAVVDVGLNPPVVSSQTSFDNLRGLWKLFFDRLKTLIPASITELTGDGRTLFLFGDNDSKPLAGIQLFQGATVARASPYGQLNPVQPPELKCRSRNDGERCIVAAKHLDRHVIIEIRPNAFSNSGGPATCQGGDDICGHDIRIFDADSVDRDDRIPSLSVDNHLSVPIVRAGIPHEGELWLIDKAGQAWVFDIGLWAPESWAKTINARAGEGWQKSRPCQERQCDTWKVTR